MAEGVSVLFSKGEALQCKHNHLPSHQNADHSHCNCVKEHSVQVISNHTIDCISTLWLYD